MTAMPPVPCADTPDLFDSTHPWDHRAARDICATCPAVQECLSRALEVANEHAPNSPHRGPWGTWGGLLWAAGSVVDVRDLRAAALVEQEVAA